jgi:hypothetical protein
VNVSDDWRVYPHGNLEPLAEGLWQISGSLPRGNIPRNMAVYRLPDGGLLLHSVICLDDQRMADLLSLGEPRFLIVPNGRHRIDAARYKRRFPEARLLCPEAARDAVSQRVAVDAAADAPEALPRGVRARAPAGLKPGEVAYEVDVAGGRALLIGDNLMNLRHLPGADGFLFRVFGSTGFFGVTRLTQLLLMRDRAAYAGWLRSLATDDLRAISVCHGDPITEACAERLREAAVRLTARS